MSGEWVDERTSEPATIEVGDYPDHLVGDAGCGQCWTGYPVACEQPDCQGLVHAVFGDESWDSYWLETKCDVCGEPE